MRIDWFDTDQEEQPRRFRWLRLNLVHKVLLSAVVFAGFFLVAWWWIGPESDEQRNEFLRTVLTAIGASALLMQLFYTHQSTTAATRTADVTEQGQYTDRFFQAVEQLASEKLDLQLGALYSLQRIAEDSPRDYRQVYEILSSFVRRRTRFVMDEQRNAPPYEGLTVQEDVLTALRILGMKRVWDESGYHIDLRDTDLRNVRLSNLDFRSADFSGANLSGAAFLGGRLDNAIFNETFADGMEVSATSLKSTYFTNASLKKANIQQVKLSNTWKMLDEASLQGADITEALLLVHDLSSVYGMEQSQIDSVGALFTDVKLPPGIEVPKLLQLVPPGGNGRFDMLWKEVPAKLRPFQRKE